MKLCKGIQLPFRVRTGFTLTEVLIAVGIVGVIAALVMPKAISYYQTEAMNHEYSRIEQTLEDSLRGLAVTENKSNFGKTSMWVSADATPSYETTSGMFLKKYLRVSKYLGDGASAEAKDAFADTYYSFDNDDGSSSAGKSRKEFTPDVSGACAILKNGASICLKPQVGADPAKGIIDMNGKKGPNVLNKDYRVLVLSAVEFTDAETNLLASTPSKVITEDHINIVPDEESPCGVDDYSEECCLYKAEKGAVTGPDHACCNNPAVASQIDACASDISINVNMYPSTCRLHRATTGYSKCNPAPYILASGTTATQNGKTITQLPKNPPSIYLFCSGRYVGYMPGTTLASAIQSNNSSQKYLFTITHASCNGLIGCMSQIKNPTCGYQSGEGIKSSKSSVVYTQSGIYKNYVYNGVNWSLKYH